MSNHKWRWECSRSLRNLTAALYSFLREHGAYNNNAIIVVTYWDSCLSPRIRLIRRILRNMVQICWRLLLTSRRWSWLEAYGISEIALIGARQIIDKYIRKYNNINIILHYHKIDVLTTSPSPRLYETRNRFFSHTVWCRRWATKCPIICPWDPLFK